MARLSCELGYIFLPLQRLQRAFNAVYRKVGSLASEEVVVQLMKTKCLSVLYYDLEACPPNESDIKALDFSSLLKYSTLVQRRC